MGPLPLSRIRVLDFTLIWAGPYAVTTLGDLGAEIIRVESLQHHITNTRGFVPWPKDKETLTKLGHGMSRYVDKDPGQRPWNRFAIFNSLGRDKLSMTADLTRKEGQEVVRELVKVCDILMENTTKGLLEGFGLDYESLRKINPTMIYLSMPLFGFSGPYADYMGFGSNGEAISGVYSLRGYTDEDRSAGGSTNHMDLTSGIAAAYAALMGLYERDRTGKGTFIEASQVEHLVHQIGGPIMDAAMNGRAQGPTGNRDPVRAPQGIYRCRGHSAGSGQAERWVALSVGDDDEWTGLCAAIGRPELSTDKLYLGNPARQNRHDELDVLIGEWTASREPRKAEELLQAHGVPAAIVANDADVMADPQLEARGFFHRIRHAESGTHRYPGHAYQLSATPLRFDSPAPLLGEHNDYVYRELLGKPPEEVQRLTDEKHIGMDYVPEVR